MVSAVVDLHFVAVIDRDLRIAGVKRWKSEEDARIVVWLLAAPVDAKDEISERPVGVSQHPGAPFGLKDPRRDEDEPAVAGHPPSVERSVEQRPEPSFT
jgi:hypothetical protein